MFTILYIKNFVSCKISVTCSLLIVIGKNTNEYSSKQVKTSDEVVVCPTKTEHFY